MMGTGEILVILVVVLILFGGKRLPEFAQSLGKGIREFKKACAGEEEVSSCDSTKEICSGKICCKDPSKDQHQ